MHQLNDRAKKPKTKSKAKKKPLKIKQIQLLQTRSVKTGFFRYSYAAFRNIGLMATTSSYSSCDTCTSALSALRSALTISNACCAVCARPWMITRCIRFNTIGCAYRTGTGKAGYLLKYASMCCCACSSYCKTDFLLFFAVGSTLKPAKVKIAAKPNSVK